MQWNSYELHLLSTCHGWATTVSSHTHSRILYIDNHHWIYEGYNSYHHVGCVFWKLKMNDFKLNFCEMWLADKREHIFVISKVFKTRKKKNSIFCYAQICFTSSHLQEWSTIWRNESVFLCMYSFKSKLYFRLDISVWVRTIKVQFWIALTCMGTFSHKIFLPYIQKSYKLYATFIHSRLKHWKYFSASSIFLCSPPLLR